MIKEEFSKTKIDPRVFEKSVKEQAKFIKECYEQLRMEE